jgi:hypothetical protein
VRVRSLVVVVIGVCAACGGGGGAAPPDSLAGPAFPSPPTTNSDPQLTPFPWVYYDETDHGSVFENIAPQWFGELSAHAGETFTATVTALVSSENTSPDPSKKIDGAVFEGVVQGDGSFVWTETARAFSSGGVLALTGTSHGDALLHVLAVEADPSSYDSSISPAVSFTYDVACAGGDHAKCALGAQPGEACTVAPNDCDGGPLAYCVAPEGSGACGNAGTCLRTDNLCNSLPPSVCTCDGTTELNECWAHSDHEQIRHDGACP